MVTGDHDFRRGLSAGFLANLQAGRLAGLIRAALDAQLDVQIRENYLNVYHHGMSVLCLSEHKRGPRYRARIHGKFLDGLQLPGALANSGTYRCFDAGDGFVSAFVTALEDVMARACPHAGPEGKVEEAILGAGRQGSGPVTFVDRQVQVHGIRKKADLVGLTATGRFVLVELKQGLDNRIQHLLTQVSEYYEVVADRDGCLREPMAVAYRRVVQQKRTLGLLPESANFPEGCPRVSCLLVLYDYNSKSQLLDRARRTSADCAVPVDVVILPKGTHALPPEMAWERLCPPR